MFKVSNSTLTKSKFCKSSYRSRYGDAWIEFSYNLRRKIRRCQWCNIKVRNTSELAGHHIGCMKYNIGHLLDAHIVMVVCDTCHKELEPYSRINLTEMLPQLFEV